MSPKNLLLIACSFLSACVAPINEGTEDGKKNLQSAVSQCINKNKNSDGIVHAGHFTDIGACNLSALYQYGDNAYGEYLPVYRLEMQRQLEVMTAVDTGKITLHDASVFISKIGAMRNSELSEAKGLLKQKHKQELDARLDRFSAAMNQLSQASYQAQANMDASLPNAPSAPAVPTTYQINQFGPSTQIQGSDGSLTMCNHFGLSTTCTATH